MNESIKNNIPMNICMQIFMWIYFLILLGFSEFLICIFHL